MLKIISIYLENIYSNCTCFVDAQQLLETMKNSKMIKLQIIYPKDTKHKIYLF